MDSIRYYNRLTGTHETEEIYGEGFLRWAYGNPLGNLSLHAFVKRPAFSKWYGWRMSKPESAQRVLPFIAKYGLNPDDFADTPGSFRSFN